MIKVRYYYCVNTFDNNDNPVQRDGFVEATSEAEAIKKLTENDVIDKNAYEFLDLNEVQNSE
jgi:hypothetical protein